MDTRVEVSKEQQYLEQIRNSYLALNMDRAAKRFKSVKRAIRRGNMTKYGDIPPKRPFNNRKRTLGREEQLLKERIYGQIRAKINYAGI